MVTLDTMPMFRTRIDYLYLEHIRIEKSNDSVVAVNKRDEYALPTKSIGCILLGPGTSITSAAIAETAKDGCTIIWCGEGATPFYTHGNGLIRSSYNIEHQAELWADQEGRIAVARRMYEHRFSDFEMPDGISVNEMRGFEGHQMRDLYKRMGKEYGVPWAGRKLNSKEPLDDINKAISIMNGVLYGIVQAGIVSGGFSPELGFIHSGTTRAFVFDVADMFKNRFVIPKAFQVVRSHLFETPDAPIDGSLVRRAFREHISHVDLPTLIIKSIKRVLDLEVKR